MEMPEIKILYPCLLSAINKNRRLIMDKVRVIYKPDGSVGIIHPAPKSRRKGETEKEWLKRVFDKATPKGVEYEDIDKSKLPKSREDREAWQGEKGKGIFVNQTKAQQLRKEKEERRLIEDEKRKILEEQAVQRLQASGKLPENYQIKK